MHDTELENAFRIADFDLMWCQRYLVAYIELMAPPKDAALDPWKSLTSREFGEHHNLIDTLARALYTSIIVSYSRPWSKNRSLNGYFRLDEGIFREMKRMRERNEHLLPFDNKLHDSVLAARNKIVAHSDSSKWGFRIHENYYAQDRALTDPLEYLSLQDSSVLLKNTESLRAIIGWRRRRLLDGYQALTV